MEIYLEDRSKLSEEEQEFYDFLDEQGYKIFLIDFREDEKCFSFKIDDFLYKNEEIFHQNGITADPSFLAINYWVECDNYDDFIEKWEEN